MMIFAVLLVASGLGLLLFGALMAKGKPGRVQATSIAVGGVLALGGG